MPPMKTETIVRDGARTERRGASKLDAQWPNQRQMVRAAQIAFDGLVVDCALLETSRGGARVHLLEPCAVPEISTLRLRGGESWTLQRRWQKGDEVGFKVVGDAIPHS